MWSGSSGCCGTHLGGPLSFGNRAPRRVRSQATALTHQGPRGSRDAAGLGTTTARGACLGGSIEWGNASIIAPGREGSQSARLPGYGRKVKPRSAPARAVSGQGRLGVVMGTWSPRFSSGIVRPVESAVKPPRRHTKARRRLSETAGLGTTTARGPTSAAVASGNDLERFDYRARS